MTRRTVLPQQPEQLTASEEKALAYARAHLTAIAFIERHLFEPLDLERVARAAGYSPSEFSRRFTRMQGESVMAYVRGRRLQRAAARMVAEPGVRLIDLALECGFESQAAFTRAFTRAFGKPPGRMRLGGSGAQLRRRRHKGPSAPPFDERVEQVPEIALVGLSQRFTPANYTEMGGLWERLIVLRQAAGGSRRDESFGVFLDREPGGAIRFLAASRAWAQAVSPPLERVTIPAGRYLVLRQHLREGPLFAQVTAVEEPLAQARQRVGARWDFERYPENFAVAGGWIDHYLPLEAAGFTAA